MPSGPVHVSMAVDRGFEVPLGVSLLSLAEAHRGEPCEVSVLCTGLGDEVYATIERDVAGSVSIDWVEVDLRRLDGARHTEGLSSAALFRILLPELLPESRARTIYLDADTLVCQPLTGLWRTGLDSGELLAAVRDAGAPYAAGPAGTQWRELGVSPGLDYLNSGLLVLPLDRWRREGTVDAALAVLRKAQMRWGDQDALNLVAERRWRELPRAWNLQTADVEERSLSWALWRDDVEAAVADPAVIHYTESPKPWTGKADHPFGSRWFAVLERSGWAGWRPDEPSKAARLRRRVTRAARVLRHGS